MLRQGSEHDGARVRVEALAVCPARLTTRHSVVAPGKSWSNSVVGHSTLSGIALREGRSNLPNIHREMCNYNPVLLERVFDLYRDGIEEETMHKGPLGSRFAISTVLLLGLLLSNSAFAEAGGKPANGIG